MFSDKDRDVVQKQEKEDGKQTAMIEHLKQQQQQQQNPAPAAEETKE
jgi:hypothetical protein